MSILWVIARLQMMVALLAVKFGYPIAQLILGPGI
jgi:hypothetical protein